MYATFTIPIFLPMSQDIPCDRTNPSFKHLIPSTHESVKFYINII